MANQQQQRVQGYGNYLGMQGYNVAGVAQDDGTDRKRRAEAEADEAAKKAKAAAGGVGVATAQPTGYGASNVGLKELMAAGMIKAGSTVYTQAGALNNYFRAAVTQDGSINFNGTQFATPGSFATTVKRHFNAQAAAEDGYDSVYVDGFLLSDLRARYVAMLGGQNAMQKPAAAAATQGMGGMQGMGAYAGMTAADLQRNPQLYQQMYQQAAYAQAQQQQQQAQQHPYYQQNPQAQMLAQQQLQQQQQQQALQQQALQQQRMAQQQGVAGQQKGAGGYGGQQAAAGRGGSAAAAGKGGAKAQPKGGRSAAKKRGRKKKRSSDSDDDDDDDDEPVPDDDDDEGHVAGHGGAGGAAEGAEPINWVQCSRCNAWRVVPDDFWPDIMDQGDDPWYCKDALWHVSEYEPFSESCQ